MRNFATQIHKRFFQGCSQVVDDAIKLKLAFGDILYILYCYNQTFKSPFLDRDEFYTYIKNKPFGDIMEELFVARDLIKNKMSKDLHELEEHLTIWKEDANKNLI